VILLGASCAGTAFGATYLDVENGTSPGSVGWTFLYDTYTSPPPYDVANWWTNQPVELSGWYLQDDATGTVQVGQLDYRFDSGAPVSFTNVLRASAEGLYTIEATGTKNSATYHASATLGIDHGRPNSWVDALPVYDNAATVTITATDTMSGANMIVHSLDNKPDFYDSCTVGNGGSLEVTAGVGSHVLRWTAVDNAGNFESAWHTLAFAVNPSAFVPQLTRPLVKISKHKATFIGATSPLTTPATVKFVVQRKSGKKYKSYATYFVNLRRYAYSYKFAKTLSATGSFQVKAYEGTGSSKGWVTFKVK
jgi:hypothetical protein